MKKMDFKQFMLEKGERVALYVACGLAALLLVFFLFWPGSGLFSGSASANAEAMKKKAEEVESKRRSAVLTARDEWQEVRDVDYLRHRKPGAPDSLRVDYLVGAKVVSEWVCVEHTGYAREKAVAWWRLRGADPPPDSVDEALARAAELRSPAEAVLVRDGKYHRIKRVRFADPEERVA